GGGGPGEPVAVHAAGGRFLAAGYCNPQTPITVRVLTHEEEAIDAALVRRRLDEALALRQATLPAGLDAYRVLNGEGDRLPGVVVDRYGDFLVCQFLTAGAARLAPAVVEGLGERRPPRSAAPPRWSRSTPRARRSRWPRRHGPRTAFPPRPAASWWPTSSSSCARARSPMT